MNKNLRLLILAVISILLLVACNNAPQRQEVISRFDGGQKKVVVTYVGVGSEELLSERQTYEVNGREILREIFTDGKVAAKVGFLELNPDMKTKSGLDSYLQGEWIEREEHSAPGYHISISNGHMLGKALDRSMTIHDDSYVCGDNYAFNLTIPGFGTDELKVVILGWDEFTLKAYDENVEMVSKPIYTRK